MRIAASSGLILALVLAGGASAAADPSSASAGLRIPAGGGTPHAGPTSTGRTPQRAAAAPTPAPTGYPVTGIDVASYQRTVDWTAVAAAGTSFALVKATEGTTYTNPYYDAQYTGALAAGLDVGSYAFGRPDADDPTEQADYLIAQSQPLTAGRTLPFMLDMESPYSGTGITDRCWNLTSAQMVSWMRAFVDEVRARTGMPTLIYTSGNWWSACTANNATFGDQLLDIAYWSAGPPTALPASWSSWTFWQYADSGSLPGDQDVFSGTRAQLDSLTYAARGPFRDVLASNPFAADISWLVERGITTGYADGTFHPAANVSRQAMAAFLYRYANPDATAPACVSKPFADVPIASAFCADIAALKDAGTLAGYRDGGFHPAATVSRQAMAAFLDKIAGPANAAPACTSAPFTDVAVGNPFCSDIQYLVSARVAAGYGDGGFHPADAVSRQAMAAFLHRLFTVTAE
ncbi:GH25 family lysozyme [uncultured Jatrophihabitans sp.]|uniref:GH25 family lysozyme n=1 Tax=uncultured Jatrophihabitans sp. TaxID=1610747 RepID=UPI0035CBC9E3